MYRDTRNAEHELVGYTGNNCSNRNNSRRYKEKIRKAVPGKLSIDLLQKTAVLGTSHTIRKVLQ